MRKVVGLFEKKSLHVTLVPKGEIPMAYNTCNKCNEKKTEDTATRRYQKGEYAVVVTNIPCSKCKCDTHFSIDNLLHIEMKLATLEVNGPVFVDFQTL